MIEYKKHFPKPFVSEDWAHRDVTWSQHYGSGKRTLTQRSVYAPKAWSDTAVRICVEKYFAGELDTQCREQGIDEMIQRVVATVQNALVEHKYMSLESAQNWAHDMCYMLVHQMFSFNSPVWFNLGVHIGPYDRPQQTSACFIVPVKDSMESISELFVTNATLFSSGSGVGTDYSSLRSSIEAIRGSVNTSSGPVSFARAHDAAAGALKSGGKTRRAAKMVTLDDRHPDLLEFVECKAKAEKAAHALVAAGFSSDFDDPYSAINMVPFQNANHSVRLSDDFMTAVLTYGSWEFATVLYGNPVEAPKAKDIFRQIAQAAWECGDPGVQFRDTINGMNTCHGDGDINSSNPCSEYLFLDNTSCNLGSLNLLKLQDTTDFFVAVRCAIIGMDALICVSDYPTPEIAEGSRNYRTLGLGFTNLGGALLDRGIAYDSDAGRAFAASRTSYMAAAAWRTSVELAKAVGPFPRYEANSEHVLAALAQHGGHAYDEWKDLPELVKEYGVRNAQLTVLAPTGTISFMMDCVTTGIEPEFGLVKHKQLVGGDWLKTVNPLVERAIQEYEYFPGQDTLAARIVAEECIPEDCPDELVQVLLTASPWGKETRSLHWRAHLKMMAACQPFLSGGISKTVNLPNDAMVEDVESVLMEAWTLGLKSVAVYRDGSKASQPLTTKKAMKVVPDRLNHASRWELPDDLGCTRHKVTIGGTDLYIHTGQHPDTAQPVEVFLTAGRSGSTLQGLLSTVGILSSQLLRRGVPASEIARMLRGQDFAPQGFTSNQHIPSAKSIPDYLAQYLERHGGEREECSHGRLCSNCGGMMTQAGSCHTCTACGQTTGCG